MTTKVYFSDNGSDDSDSVEVFFNKFSDNDEEEEDSIHENAILTVRNTNVLTPSSTPNYTPTVTRPNTKSLESNFDQKADDKNIPSGTSVDEYREHSFSYYTSSSETSGTDSDDDSTSSSDDYYADNWAPDPRPARSHLNKNVIPIGRDPAIARDPVKDKHLIHTFPREQEKHFPTNTNYSAPYKQTSQSLSRDIFPDHGKKPVPKRTNSNHQSNVNAKVKTQNLSENYGRRNDGEQTLIKKPNHSEKLSKDVNEIKCSSGAESKQLANLLKTGHERSLKKVTDEKLHGRHWTGPMFGRNAGESHQFESQSYTLGNSDFCSWNDNWTTEDYLICPNFLLGAPNVQDNFDAREMGQSPRIPRMFHRRVKKDVDASRDDRSSNETSNMNNHLAEVFKIVKEMGIDITKFLEKADSLGLPMQFPCMQCHDGSSMSEIATDLMSGSRSSLEGRCQRCGGQLQTFASLGKTITKLRDLVAKNNFEIRDVYPDGNCMFGTVIDQLRVRGDFRFTVHTLRAAVVDYLRENPKAEDGTPLEMFLTNETWDEYLKRMSEDGQWGDHMVLNAITNVLQMRILIFGGRNGETETELIPKSAENQATEASSSEMTYITTIYMGHLGETHYVSFRPENWWYAIQRETFRTLLEWEHRKFNPKESLYVPVQHLDFIVRHTIQLEHISNYMSPLADIPDDHQDSEYTLTFVGPLMCKMVPDYTSQVESIAPDISQYFPDTIYKEPISTCAISGFETPCDTCIQDSMSEHKSLNLLTEKSSSDLSHVRLLPVEASLWKGQTIESSEGVIYLKVIDLKTIPLQTILPLFTNEKLALHRTLAFKSKWPEFADEWISRERKSGMPEEFVIQTVVSVGCHVVPILPDENLNNVIDSFITAEMIEEQDLWSYSFAVAEIKLSSYISHSQRCCFLLLKSLLDFTCNNHTMPAALQKSVFFFACENIEADTWCRMPGRCLIIMLEKLAVGLRMNFVPHYFISAQNLLQNIPSDQIVIWAKYIEGILKQPVVSLYFVFDLLDITSSEIGAVFDDIIEDLPKFNSHKRIERSFNETLIPSAGHLIENLIYQKEFDFAMKSLEDVQKQVCQFTKQPLTVAEIINMVVPYIAIGYKWCLGLYIDLMKGTAVTRELGSRLEVVHITEVFGPDIEDEVMSNTVVPAIYSISSGDLIFPSVCGDVMLKAGRKALLAKCLRYYLTTYSEIAGNDIVICQQTCTQYQLKGLQGLYMTLLRIYDDLGCVSEFRKFMDNFTMIIQLRQVHSGFHSLAEAWEKLGERKLALSCCPCYFEHKDGLKSIVRRYFGGRREYDY